MSWKKALFFGGAVLVLSACSRDATGPSSYLAVEGAQAAAKTPSTNPPKTTTKGKTATAGEITGDGLECTGVVIRTGEGDLICVLP